MNWADFAYGFAFPLCWAAWLARHSMRPQSVASRWMRQAVITCAGYATGTLIPGFAFLWNDVAGSAVSLLCAYVLWLWLRRRNRGKAVKLLGAKSRAVRDAIVRRARESAKPGPVMKPSLRGAS